MWEKNKNTYRNKSGQEATLSFRLTSSSDWKYQDKIYKRIYEVKLETQWGVRQFWYCFPEDSFANDELCEIYLRSQELAFEPLQSYLETDISKGLDLGAVLPHVSSSVLVFGRTQ